MEEQNKVINLADYFTGCVFIITILLVAAIVLNYEGAKDACMALIGAVVIISKGYIDAVQKKEG